MNAPMNAYNTNKPRLDLQTHKMYKAMRKKLALKVNYSINVEITNE